MKNILILCVGNICRSPTAEAMFKQKFPDKKIWSAGLAALVGNAADPMSIQVAAQHGLDLSEHRAQQVQLWMCQAADVIFVMESVHKTELEKRFPIIRGKVFGLGDISNFQIADPYRQSTRAFEAAYAEIDKGVKEWIPRIIKIS